jgi:hypothetical protein
VRIPDTPPRDFELRILKWVGYPLLALLLAGFVAWAWHVRGARVSCESHCAASGATGFIYIPADRMRAQDEECICKP